MSSTTGRSPAWAAPTAIPTKAVSDTGVSKTRDSPNSRWRPRVAPKTPPRRPTSSPKTTTEGSRAISWRSTAATRWAPFPASGAGSVGIHTGPCVRRPRKGILPRRAEPALDSAFSPCRGFVKHGRLDPRFLGPGAQDRDGISHVSRLLLLRGRTIEVEIPLVVTPEPVRPRDHERRAPLLASNLERRPQGGVHGGDVGPVAAESRNAERVRAPDKLPRRGLLLADREAVGVVLAEEDHRKPGNCGKVHRLEHGALVHGAIPGDSDGYPACLVKALPQRVAQGKRCSRAHDPGAHETGLRIEQVHVAALAVIQPVSLQDLSQHQHGIHAEGEGMQVRTVGRHHDVATAQMQAERDRDGLLADPQVHLAVDLAGGHCRGDRLLNLPVGDDRLEEADEVLCRHCRYSACPSALPEVIAAGS